MDISEDLLAKIPAEGLPPQSMTLDAGVAYLYQEDIQKAVHSFILDREWAEPIIHEAITKVVKEVITDMLGNTVLGDMLNSQEPMS